MEQETNHPLVFYLHASTGVWRCAAACVAACRGLPAGRVWGLMSCKAGVVDVAYLGSSCFAMMLQILAVKSVLCLGASRWIG